MAAVASIPQPLPSAFDKSRLDDIQLTPQLPPHRPAVTSDSPSSSAPSLPTLTRLGVDELPNNLDALHIARVWMQSFERYVSSCEVEGILSLMVEDSFWRDVLAMTWDFRVFQDKPHIRRFLLDRLSASNLTSLKLDESVVQLQQPYPDLAWVQALFNFETDNGTGSGVFRLIPLRSSNGALEWKAHVILTNLDDLKGFPEKIGSLREQLPNHGKWLEQRRRELEFKDADPKVLVVGAGHAGLQIAARLKYLDVPTLVVERHPRVGDNWRTRYESLNLHTPAEMDHMAYLPFPSTWPRYPAGRKLADWLESYAQSLELDVWTSAEVTEANQDETSKKWTVTVKRLETGQERKFTVDHLICALGWTGGLPKVPVYPAMEAFKGQIIHSSQYNAARDYLGKRVAVIGACTSAHDICADLAEHGVDATMVQRSGTCIVSVKEGNSRAFTVYTQGGLPIEKADLMFGSFPGALLKLMQKRLAKVIAEADAELLDGLRRRGFKLSMGDDGAGYYGLVRSRGGGYYLEMGASQMIVDGKIKLKSDSLIDRFTETGLMFQDGTELSCDLVIFATGYQRPRDGMLKLLGDQFGGKLKPIWDLDAEGEHSGAWRDVGVPNLWYMMGGLGQCRTHSKHLALQIKALEEGLWDGNRYSA
ncbi:FAD/NAD(P)-binding domain-containing protein [Heliocybe sulcata]|uniref:FAD/NAD(P)-binding domain-containing protein n=1 Tax=Heliocybe sulcata TaxID=5364 RepID=A0A5C3MTE6_9AGAM|nr:FAD/NAD(P)-binding domain-containing protein [Heliocybe sulcata]